jgi:hypothetical protein
MSWKENVARMGEMKNACRCLFENLKGREFSENVGVNEREILNYILGKYGSECVLDSAGCRYGSMECSYEHSNEPSDAIICR